MELVYIYAVMSLLALVGIIWLQIKMRKDKRGILLYSHNAYKARIPASLVLLINQNLITLL